MSKIDSWKIDGYTAKSPDGQYELWIANGFISFTDYSPHFPKQTLVEGAGLFNRYKLWREIKRVRKQRLKDFLAAPPSTIDKEQP